MKTIAVDPLRSRTSRGRKRSASATSVQQYFNPIKGQRPWRVRLGVGSFLTFELGPRMRANGHEQGLWHLWIYMSKWALMHRDRQLVNSDSDRHPISVAVRRLKGVDFTGMEFDPKNSTTVFLFADFRLIVTPADYLDSPDERDEYWLFFMPDNLVLTVGPGGIDVRRSDIFGVKQELPAKTVKRASVLSTPRSPRRPRPSG